MTNREEFITKYRGENLGAINPETLPDELFQNQTLRPILKLQNEILIEIVKDYTHKKQPLFNTFDIQRKNDFIEQSISNDQKFQNIMKGITIGFFSVNELDYYLKNAQTINKRILSLIKERILSQIQLI
jgi:hypothetical protein